MLKLKQPYISSLEHVKSYGAHKFSKDNNFLQYIIYR